MQGAEGGLGLLPTRNSEGRSALRKRILGLAMVMMLVYTSESRAFAGIRNPQMSRNTHALEPSR